MPFRLGLALGLVIGYVLGAKAGRERYQQIQSLWGSVRQSDPAQQIGAEVSDVASKATKAVESKAADGITKVSRLVRRSEETEEGPSA